MSLVQIHPHHFLRYLPTALQVGYDFVHQQDHDDQLRQTVILRVEFLKRQSSRHWKLFPKRLQIGIAEFAYTYGQIRQEDFHGHDYHQWYTSLNDLADQIRKNRCTKNRYR